MREPQEVGTPEAHVRRGSFLEWNNKQAVLLLGLGVLAILLIVQQEPFLLGKWENPPDFKFMNASSATARPGGSFDLKRCILPTETLLSGGPPKDGIPALTSPRLLPTDEAVEMNPEDRVVGVSFGGEAIAYPLRILNWHECINDTVGGKPLAVTYCPLCDSAFVFDRNIASETVEFGISGLLLNSNVLLYDRRNDESPSSLWSQVAMRAICGPAAEASSELTLLPSSVVTWRHWKRLHPRTKVVSFDTGYPRDYRTNPYTSYFDSQDLVFPVKNLFPPPHPIPQSLPPKEPVLVVEIDGHKRVYPFSSLSRASGKDGLVHDTFHSTPLVIDYDSEMETAEVSLPEGLKKDVATAQTFWFAWKALQGNYEVFGD